MFLVADDHVGITSGGTHRFSVHGSHVRVTANGTFFVSECANGNAQIGATINQLANDNEIFALKSSDVDHSFTGATETDTYLFMKKYSAASGGAIITGIADGANTALYLAGWSECDVSNAKTTGANATVMTDAYKADGSGSQNVGCNYNIFAVKSYNISGFIVDKDGELFANGGSSTTAVTVFDAYCDPQLIRTLSHVDGQSDVSGLVNNRWDEFIEYNECTLIDLGLIGGPRSGRPADDRGLINVTGMMRLHNGAIWQLHSKLNDQEEELVALRGQLTALQEGK